jgi:hypothetical protein
MHAHLWSAARVCSPAEGLCGPPLAPVPCRAAIRALQEVSARCVVSQCVRKAVHACDLGKLCRGASCGATRQDIPCCPYRPDGTRAEIYLKREDLNHTGAHKINNSLGQVRGGIACWCDVSKQWRWRAWRLCAPFASAMPRPEAQCCRSAGAAVPAHGQAAHHCRDRRWTARGGHGKHVSGRPVAPCALRVIHDALATRRVLSTPKCDALKACALD